MPVQEIYFRLVCADSFLFQLFLLTNPYPFTAVSSLSLYFKFTKTFFRVFNRVLNNDTLNKFIKTDLTMYVM